MKISQDTWEIWFVISCIIFLGMLFIGTVGGFDETWTTKMLLACINMIVCIWFGVRKVK